MAEREFKIQELILLLVIVAAFVFHSVSLSFTQDDAYISYRYVENFQSGHGLVFNYGERVEGYTNFLWILLLSLASMMGFSIIATSKLLGVASGALTLVFAYQICRDFGDSRRWLIPFAAPAFLAANGALAYWVIGGLETGLFVFLVTLSIYAEFKRPSVQPALLVIATLTRPEGGLLFGIILIYRILVKRDAIRSLAVYAGMYAGLLIPYAIFKIYYFGDLLPNPFYAKTGMSIEYLNSGIEYFTRFAYHYGLFGIFYLLPFAFLKSMPNKVKFLWLASVIYTVYIILVGGDVLKVHRFFLPVLPMLFGIMTYALYRLVIERSGSRVVQLVASLVVVGYLAWSLIIPKDYILQTRLVERSFLNKMTFMAENLKRVDRSRFSLATTTIGKVSYVLKGKKIIDMLGLTDPEIAKNPEKIEGMKTTWKERNFNTKYLLDQRPDYILFSTGQKPSAPAERALVLNSHFRRNYSTLGFLMGGTEMKLVWKKTGDFADSNEVLSDLSFADHVHDGLNIYASASGGDMSQAIEHFQKAAKMCGHDFPVLEFFTGLSFLQTNEADSALYYFRRALELNPLQVETRYTLYRSLKDYGDLDGAKEHAEALRKVAPWLVD